jgi:hypothetical protein
MLFSLHICVVTSGPVQRLLKTIASIERAVEVALASESISAATLEIASLGGEWNPEIDAEGILSAPRPHLVSIRAHQLDERETKANAYNLLMNRQVADALVMVQGGVLLSPITLANLIGTLKLTRGALIDARRLPIEVNQHYDPITGRTGHANPFCVAISAFCFRKLGGFDAVHFPSHLFTIDFSWRARAAKLACVLEPAAIYFFDDKIQQPEENAELVEETVLLSHKWSQFSLRDKVLNYCRASKDYRLLNVAASFEYRSRNGYLPNPVECGHAYAQFAGDCFPSQMWSA